MVEDDILDGGLGSVLRRWDVCGWENCLVSECRDDEVRTRRRRV